MSAPPAERVTYPTQGQATGRLTGERQPQSMEGLCPDELVALREMRALGISIRPADLHRMYLKVMANADADFDFGAHVLTRLLGRSGSRPVDTRVGERVARRLTH